MTYSAIETPLFPSKIQTPLNWFAFFIGYPFLSILGNSVTFYIFVYILLFTYSGFLSQTFKLNNWPKKLLFLFGFVALLSIILAPWSQLRDINANPFIMFFQLLYWISLALFIIQYYHYINLYQIFKYFSLGLILHILAFYILKDLIFNIGPINFELAHSKARNGLNFQIIALGPFLLYLLKKNQSIFYFILGTAFLVASALFTDGRAGSILVFLQCVLFWGNKIFFKPIYIFTGLALIIFINLFAVDLDNYSTMASYQIEPYNERLAQLMRGQSENTSLEEDRSLLERDIHRKKGKEVFGKFPFFGLGFGNYGNYDADLYFLNDPRYLRMRGKSAETLNKRSAHNSYVQVLSETGGIGFLFFILCFLPATFILFSKTKNSLISVALFVSILGTLGHLYAIAAAYGAVFWIIIALANAEAFNVVRINHSHKLSQFNNS